MATSRVSCSAKHGGGGGKAGFKSSRPTSVSSCMPSADPADLMPLQDAIDIPCFTYDCQAKCRLQEYVVGPRMRRSAPIYAIQKPDNRWRDKGSFFVKMEVAGVGIWFGRGSSQKIAESSAAICGLIDLGVDTLKQHSGQPAAETVKIPPVPPNSVRQYPYDDQAKCRLQEFIVGRTMRLPAPKYAVLSVPSHQKDSCYIVKMDIQNGVGTWFGSGLNKKHAECSAAMAALVDLRVCDNDQRARQSDAHFNVASVQQAL
jgi:dsRNA-specific ribonuclease